jgi:RNAse (barnase) inhibitor barstar
MAAREEGYTATSRELTQLKCENDLLCGGTVPPSEQDRELKVAYRRLSNAEHAWHYIRQQLDASWDMVDEWTHAIIHLEHANEQQDFELVERAAVIASLEQQVQMLQLLVLPAPAAPAMELNVISDVDEA